MRKYLSPFPYNYIVGKYFTQRIRQAVIEGGGVNQLARFSFL